MLASLASRLRYALLGAAGAALVLVTATALAGSGVGGVFNLGQVNTVDVQTSLTGNPGGNPLLKVTSTGTAAAVRGIATNGIGTNGISTSGVGQQGFSDSGIGTLGTHSLTTGISPGVQGETNSTDPNGAGVVGKNNGRGPGLKAIVNAGAPPLAVNSSVKVANLNADLLDGLDSTALQKRVTGTCGVGSAIKTVNADGTVVCEPVGGGGVWSLTGNSGTTPGTNFLGTTDNKLLAFKVNGQTALRLVPNSISPNLIGGFSGNGTGLPFVPPDGVTIAGGGEAGSPNVVTADFGTVGGGRDNTATVFAATVGGGTGNTASDEWSTVSGGFGNMASAVGSSVGGGANNTASNSHSTVQGGSGNTASGTRSTVGSGENNTASGTNSTVPGGDTNTAGGSASFAAGSRAHANHQGAFVWADRQLSQMASSGDNQFIARAQGHFFLQSDSTLDNQGGFINTSTGAFLSTGGMWTNASSRSLKAGFARVRPKRILEKVSALPLATWHYKAEPGVRHLGPVSEDFHRAFTLGAGSRAIGTVDADGVALAAIQGLYRENQKLKHRLARLERKLARLTR